MNVPIAGVSRVAVWLGIVLAAALTASCGGSSSVPGQMPPSSIPIVSGGRFVASGSKGVTFDFAIGAGVPAGETAIVSVLPTPPSCTGPACTAVQAPIDGFELTVGPQPLAVGALTSVVLAGVTSPFDVSLVVQDATDFGSFANFLLLHPTGGTVTITDPASMRPVLALVPNHLYTIAIYATSIPPS